MSKKLRREAQRLHTHTVVFQDGDNDSECAARALLGQSTQAIMRATGLSESQVLYRVRKAGVDRWAMRNENNQLSTKIVQAGIGLARQHVNWEIAPKWAKFAPK